MANENETVEQVCLDTAQSLQCEEVNYVVMSVMRDALDRIEAAHKRELAAKDAEIARLKRENFDLNGCLLAEQELAEKRNALIKELAEDLSGYLCESECNVACSSFGHCCSQTSHQIVAKAREILEVAK